MAQTKRIFIGKVPCLRCETSAEVRQGGAGFLYTHCQICGDNFSRSAGFQEKIWRLTEFIVEDRAIDFSRKPDGLTIKKNISEKITTELEEKGQKQHAAQRTEQQPDTTKQKAENVERIKKSDDLQLSAIIPTNVLLYKEESEEKKDFIKCDEVEESSTSHLLFGLGGVSCLGYFLLKLFV